LASDRRARRAYRAAKGGETDMTKLFIIIGALVVAALWAISVSSHAGF
jgi:hypothetical protein